jgi:RNA polymerase sigma-70 factor (ECF subfamily)
MPAPPESAVQPDRERLEHQLAAARPLVYRWALVRSGDADDAEDITQMVMLRVHAALDSFRGDARFTTWLYRVTANTATELERRRGVWHRLRQRWSQRQPVTTDERDPVDTIEDARVRDHIVTLLLELPASQRCAFDLVDLQGCSPADAAAMLGIRAGTLRVHLLRARRALRRRILAEHATE